ncbi:phage tail tape measure protein [Muricauda sp. MAR_2010_75]|uniref:phage tail tape measure protein n=1 Tax=Allomuricauda sp. MAR_2010_75 TaxID=1250232 RepID=UPI00056844EC|nr:phage tail tape measure protein [Muricauda sp. MAR_2010_75]
MPATVKIPAEFKAVDKTSHVLRKMTAGVRKYSKNGISAVRRLDARFTKSLNRMKRSVGSFGAYLGGAALVGALGGAIMIMADYEQANANLASVLDVNIEQTAELQKSSQRLGATTAFTAGEVAGLQTEYAKLGFTEKEILKVTDSTLALAAATKTELSQAAMQVGSTLRAFNYEASEASRIADVFAASTSKSALNMEFLNTAMSIVAPVASKFGFEVEEVTALLGSLADSGFDASSAATATRNILLNLADSNGKLAKSLGRPVKDLPSLVAGLKELDARGTPLAKMLELTDKRSVAAFATFVSGTDKTLKLNSALGEAGSTAQKMAEKQLDTLTGKTTILKSAYEGFILSLDNGKGPYSDTIKNVVMVATEMLSMASGTAKAESELTTSEKTIRQYAKTAIQVLKILGWLAAAFVVFKVALAAYTIVQGIMTAATWVATAASTAFAVAVNLGLWPILLIIAAIAALIAIFYYWDDIIAWFSKQWEKFTSWIGKVWDRVVKWFKEFDFKEFFKKIGQSILKFLLMPMKALLTLLSKIPGKIGKMASMGLEKIGDLTGETEVNLNNPKKPLESPELKSAKVTNETIQQNRITMDINDPGGHVGNVSNEGPTPIPVNLRKTQGRGQ